MLYTSFNAHTHTWPRVHKSVICVNKGDVPDLQTALFYSLLHVRSEECLESFHLWNTVENGHTRDINTPHVSDYPNYHRVRPQNKELLPTEWPPNSRAKHLSTNTRHSSRCIPRTQMYVFIMKVYFIFLLSAVRSEKLHRGQDTRALLKAEKNSSQPNAKHTLS